MHHARPGEHCIRHARAPARGLKLRLCAIERLVCAVKEVDIAHAGIVAARNADANKLIVLPPPLSNQKEQPREHDRTRQIARADNAKRRHGQKQRQGFVSTPRRFRRSPKNRQFLLVDANYRSYYTTPPGVFKAFLVFLCFVDAKNAKIRSMRSTAASDCHWISIENAQSPSEMPMLLAARTACASAGTNFVLPATSESGLWETVLPTIATA